MKNRIRSQRFQSQTKMKLSYRLFVLFLGLSMFSAGPLFAQVHLADPGYVHNHKANQLFDSGKYKAALQEYIQALSLRDNSPEVKYNMGNAFVKSGRVDDAIKTYQDMLNKAPDDLKPRLFYNTGNALFQAKKYKDAAEFYRKTLLADPGDRWAKENYEMSLRKIQEQKQQQQKKQNDQKKDDKKKQDQKQKQNQNQKQNKAEKQKKEQKQPPSAQQQKKKRAERMLKALREQEKQDRKKNAKKKAVRPVERNVKDW